MQKAKQSPASAPTHEDLFDKRNHFQLERLILFSDAVFAIVITLLIIEIKVPETATTGMLNSHELKEALGELFPHFLGFLMSFFVIGIFWQTHHRMFGFVVSYDKGLIWNNLLLLLCICVLPFTTSLVSEYGYLDFAYIIYSINLGCIGLMSFLTWMHISHPKRELSVGLQDKKERRYRMVRSLTVCLIFFSGALLCLPGIQILSVIARFVFILIFPAMIFLRKLYHHKQDV